MKLAICIWGKYGESFIRYAGGFNGDLEKLLSQVRRWVVLPGEKLSCILTDEENPKVIWDAEAN